MTKPRGDKALTGLGGSGGPTRTEIAAGKITKEGSREFAPCSKAGSGHTSAAESIVTVPGGGCQLRLATREFAPRRSSLRNLYAEHFGSSGHKWPTPADTSSEHDCEAGRPPGVTEPRSQFLRASFVAIDLPVRAVHGLIVAGRAGVDGSWVCMYRRLPNANIRML